MLTLALQRSPHLDVLGDELAGDGFGFLVTNVDDELLPGGNDILVLRNPA